MDPPELGPKRDHLVEGSPGRIPGLEAFWVFDRPGDHYTSVEGAPLVLTSRTESLGVVSDLTAPFGSTALELKEGQWLSCPRAHCPQLDFHGSRSALTVVAWLKRGRKSDTECEFIAGQWNETERSRQYGLFLNISVWQQTDQVCGHLSSVGGPTPGYRYCMDGPVGTTPIQRDRWTAVAMSFDGNSGYAWVDGVLDVRPGLNPYLMGGGLNDGREAGSDFTVGAVDRGGVIGNFYTGLIAGLAVYSRALTPAEIWAVCSPWTSTPRLTP